MIALIEPQRGFWLIIWLMQDTYEILEFQQIREKVASYCHSEGGKKKALSLEMIEEERLLRNELDFLSEMMSLLNSYGNPPLGASFDLSSSLSLAKKGGTLSVQELDRVASDIESASELKSFFSKMGEYPLLHGYASNFPELSFISQAIHKVIAPDLSIYDNASPKLRSIRQSILRIQRSVDKKMQSILEANKEYLSEGTITIRNGHYALAVKNAYKRKVRGLVQDVSNTGGTTFIEPSALVEMDNKLIELSVEEKDEIRRILSSLSKDVANHSEEIKESNEMVSYIDFLSAKGNYALASDSIIPIFPKDPYVDLKEARHPLIEKDKAVPNDFTLKDGEALAIISGPNAGGKTVALKTLGLLTLMHQSALAIPAKEGSSLSKFNHIYVDIGDSQSLSENLSTFSAHIKNVSDILPSLGGKDMILFDELGTGTSPKEGESLAIAITRYLLKKHVYGMISSHYEGLKAMAMEDDRLVNASMLFDEKNFLPTYKMVMGLPGESYGFAVARRFGLSDEILEDAKKERGNEGEAGLSIKRLAALNQEAEKKRLELMRRENELERREKSLSSKENALNIKESKINEEIKEGKEAILDEYEEKISQIIKDLSKEGLKTHEAIEAKGKLNSLREERNIEHFSDELKVGDYVDIPSLFLQGRIHKIDGKKIEVLTPEGISIRSTVDKAHHIEEPNTLKASINAPKVHTKIDTKGVSLECNLIGERAEEAKNHLASYLDSCLVKGFTRVRIIHGWGNGVLRKITRDYCDAHKNIIDHYENADGAEGGGGATIVFLKR